MKLSNKVRVDLLLGSALSLIFCTLLIVQIMRGGVGESITFREFLTLPENILYCLAMSMFFFASWLFRGINNKVVLVCWALVYVLSYVIFSEIYDYYYYEQKNIYMLMFAGLAGIIPSLLIIRHRAFVTTIVLEPIGKAGIFKKQISHYLCNATATDYEVNMTMTLYIAFGVEFLYSLYMVSYGLLNNIPYNGSITEHLRQNNIWDPYSLYYWMLNTVTFCYISITAFYIYRENTDPDAYMHGFTRMERRQASLKVLEKYRKQAERKKKKKRD